jgi:hypothetical protein
MERSQDIEVISEYESSARWIAGSTHEFWGGIRSLPLDQGQDGACPQTR